jgi:hypothetical protein
MLEAEEMSHGLINPARQRGGTNQGQGRAGSVPNVAEQKAYKLKGELLEVHTCPYPLPGESAAFYSSQRRTGRNDRVDRI